MTPLRRMRLCASGSDRPAPLIRQAAIKAGVIVVANKKALRFGVCDVTAASRLSETSKARLLRELFLALGVNAQCTFLKGLDC
jgi:hypothetical protein